MLASGHEGGILIEPVFAALAATLILFAMTPILFALPTPIAMKHGAVVTRVTGEDRVISLLKR